ncbi:MAG: hypothetical protein AAF485_32985, partial [Chloroflexota bacterium]
KAKLNNLPPEAPTDLRLGNGDHTIDPPESPIAVLFEWNPVTDPDQRPGEPALTYTVQIAEDPDDFDNSIVFQRDEIALFRTQLDQNTPILDGRTTGTNGLIDGRPEPYAWRVLAIDSFGGIGFSEIHLFKVNEGNRASRAVCAGSLDSACKPMFNANRLEIGRLQIRNLPGLDWLNIQLRKQPDGSFVVAGFIPSSPGDPSEPFFDGLTGMITLPQVDVVIPPQRLDNVQMELMPEPGVIRFRFAPGSPQF